MRQGICFGADYAEETTMLGSDCIKFYQYNFVMGSVDSLVGGIFHVNFLASSDKLTMFTYEEWNINMMILM